MWLRRTYRRRELRLMVGDGSPVQGTDRPITKDELQVQARRYSLMSTDMAMPG